AANLPVREGPQIPRHRSFGNREKGPLPQFGSFRRSRLRRGSPFSLDPGKEGPDGGSTFLRHFFHRNMAHILEDHEFGLRNPLLELVSGGNRDKPVLVAPHHKGW